MGEYAVKRIDEMDAAFAGAYKRVRAELGASAFGIQVLDLPPSTDQYPEHDHAEDGQEEVYVVMRGGGEIDIAGERFPLESDTCVRVGPGVKRKLYSGIDGMRVLALGGVPGEAYRPSPLSELGAPESLAPLPPDAR